VLRAGGDQRGALTALNNAALARIGLGQLAAARSALDEILAAYQGAAAAADQATTLREFADAFAAAGDLSTALQLYHRERKLVSAMMDSNRQTVLAELRERFDREAQQRWNSRATTRWSRPSLKTALPCAGWLASAVLLGRAWPCGRASAVCERSTAAWPTTTPSCVRKASATRSPALTAAPCTS
jgi:hypothetical protein